MRTGRALQGTLALAWLPRLSAAVERTDGTATYDLVFERDPHGRAVIRGRVQARLWLLCQRCLGEMPLDVDAEIRLGLVPSEALAERLPDDLEPLVVADGASLSPGDLIEDELLLAIPAVPRHPLDADASPCRAAGVLAPVAAEPGPTGPGPLGAGGLDTSYRQQRPGDAAPVPGNPFAVLEALKGKH